MFLNNSHILLLKTKYGLLLFLLFNNFKALNKTPKSSLVSKHIEASTVNFKARFMIQYSNNVLKEITSYLKGSKVNAYKGIGLSIDQIKHCLIFRNQQQNLKTVKNMLILK